MIFGQESVKGFQFDLPAFLIEAIKCRGPVHTLYPCPTTSPDRLVPLYVNDWWNSKDLVLASANLPKLTEIQKRALICHNTMVRHI
jgi:hypothetical protein